MKIIFSKSIAKKEQIHEREKNFLAKAYAKGIFTVIKGESLPKNSRLAKFYLTTRQGAYRALFLVDMFSGDGFFLFYRSKNDKIGKNITIQNENFKQALWKYLLILKQDIQVKNYEVFEASSSL